MAKNPPTTHKRKILTLEQKKRAIIMFSSTPIKAVADYFDVDIQQIRRLKNNEDKQKQIIDEFYWK
jgi:DNA invertase Pin-like site-specific DNA recombinase